MPLRRFVVLAYFALSSFFLTACLDATQVTLSVSTDVPYENGNGVAISVSKPEESNLLNPTVASQSIPPWNQTSPDETGGFDLGTLVIKPVQDKSSRFSVLVAMTVGSTDPDAAKTPEECELKKGKGCIVQRRSMSFSPHKSFKLPVRLYKNCANIFCDEGLTCNAKGDCVPAVVLQASCEERGDCHPTEDPPPDLTYDASVTASEASPPDVFTSTSDVANLEDAQPTAQDAALPDVAQVPDVTLPDVFEASIPDAAPDACSPTLQCGAGLCGLIPDSCGNTIDCGPCDAGSASPIVQIAAGGDHTCALNAEGSIYCWGRNDRGQLGTDGNALPMARPESALQVPIPPAKKIVLGQNHSCALTNTNSIICWGDNTFGQIGIGSRTSEQELSFQELPSMNGGEWQDLQSGDNHLCAITVSRLLFCWGDNSSHQAGEDPTTVPFLPSPKENMYFQNDPVFDFYSFGNSNCASSSLKPHYYCWGENSKGQLGAGIFTSYDRQPLAATNGNVVKHDAWGFGGNLFHACYRDLKGDLYCWGRNDSNQLGFDSSGSAVAIPRFISNVPKPGDFKFSGIAAGNLHTCVFGVDRQVFCFGDNQFGQLGISSQDPFPDPVIPPNLEPLAIQLAAGNHHTCVLYEDGRILCWGDSHFLQSGQDGIILEPRLINLTP